MSSGPVLEPFLPVERSGRRGRPWMPHRRVVNAILWRTRTGAAWRDLPVAYGSWQTIYGRHRTWSTDGTWDRALRGLQRGSDGDDPEWVVSVDSTSVRAHHHAAGARKVAPVDVSAERLAVAVVDDQPEVVVAPSHSPCSRIWLRDLTEPLADKPPGFTTRAYLM